MYLFYGNSGWIGVRIYTLYIYINTETGLAVSYIALVIPVAIAVGVLFGVKIFFVSVTVGEIWVDLETPFYRIF